MSHSRNTKKPLFPSVNIYNPSFRYLEVKKFLSLDNYTKKKAIPKGFCEVQTDLVRFSRGTLDEERNSFYDKAMALEAIPTCRSILRGLLISGDSLNVIASIAKESVEVLEVYRKLFFDTEVFLNDLIKIAYIRDLPSDTPEQSFEKQLVSWGHYLGSKYIAWKIGCKLETTPILPSEAVRKVLDDSIWRSSEHCMEEIDSRKAKESRSWVPQVLKSAEILNSLETTSGMETALAELKIKLKGSDQTNLENLDDMDIKG